MKSFSHIGLSSDEAAKELDRFKKLLASQKDLSEKNDILPFFKRCKHLSTMFAMFNPNISSPDRIAMELNLFGDFACDLAVGDSSAHAYSLIEFEDARRNSVFQKGVKSTPEWGRRFEHGFSQLVDWFWRLEDQRTTNSFRTLFGDSNATFFGMLIIGRSGHLKPREVRRLEWRQEKVVINSNKILCLTFDELVRKLEKKLADYPRVVSRKGAKKLRKP
jgi:hypothetical protein